MSNKNLIIHINICMKNYERQNEKHIIHFNLSFVYLSLKLYFASGFLTETLLNVSVTEN